MTKNFIIGQKVKFTKDWANRVSPNFGTVDKRVSKDKEYIWVKFDVEAPPANVLLVPVDKLEIDE